MTSDEINHQENAQTVEDANTESTLPGNGFDAPMEIQNTLCLNCDSGNGLTRLLLTRIPHFKEVILVSFSCPDCHWKNVDVQFGGKYGERGVNIELKVLKPIDLNRQIVKSDYCTVSIPELELEIPPQTQKGCLSTVEGVLSKTVSALKEEQPVRKHTHPEVYEKIEEIAAKVDKYLQGEETFTFCVYDPSGNSYIENLCLPAEDPQLKNTYFERTVEQNHELGLGLVGEESQRLKEEREKRERIEEHRKKSSKVVPSFLQGEEAEKFNLRYVTSADDVAIMEENCTNCGVPGEIRNLLCNIPHFGEVLLCAFACEKCGYKTNDVKAGGGIPPNGTRITLKITNPEDMNRDVLKSDTSRIEIPEIPIEITEGTLGGKFTTVEGILSAIEEQFLHLGSFSLGDSEYFDSRKLTLIDVIKKLQELKTGEKEFTFIIDDPLSHSFIQNYYAPDPDPNMIVEIYERSQEQNDDLGISDMVV